MALPAQLFNDLSKDLLVAARLDGELFARKYTRRVYWVLNQAVDLNIYSEPVDRRAQFLVSAEVPCRMKLNPDEDMLTKYGFEVNRDAVLVFSRYLMENEFGIQVKIGDRVDHSFADSDGTTITEQYELKDVKKIDAWRDSGYFMHYVCAASKTTKAVKP